MKTIAAVLATFAVFLISWLLLVFLLSVMGYTVLKSGHQPGFLIGLHLLAIWVLCPGIGSGLAIFATCQSFGTVSKDLILHVFVAICSALFLLLLTMQISRTFLSDAPLSESIIFVLQVTSVLGGAGLGRRLASS